MTAAELPKTYAPAEHEPRIWQRWIESGAFRADPARVLSGEKPPYCILIPPPNVTAALHLGHALNNTLQDVLIRAHRMKGFEALWMPGTDHAGIATQTVVDRKLKEAGQPALADYKKMQAAGEPGREKFIEKVQTWKDEFEARIVDQLKQMGCSCDWDRQRFTMDEICARAVREAFFRLFRDGLIYRGKRLVNWDPVTQTALADDEVENEEVDGAFYYLRYPLVHETEPGNHNPVTWGELEARGYPGADQHPEDDNAWVTVATTRPETYLGDTGVAINPTDPRADAVRGLKVELPLIGRIIPIVEDDFVVKPVRYGGPEGDTKAQYATGFLKVTPAHDPNDWELGQRHNLEPINIMAPDASISANHGWHDYAQHSPARVFIGLSREDARKKVIQEFQAHTINSQPLLEEIKPYRHSVGHSYRSHAAVEYYLSDQWYCRVTDDRLVGAAQRALKPEQRTTDTYPSPPPRGTGVPPVSTTPPLPRGTGVPPVSPHPSSSSSTPQKFTTHERNLPHWQLGGSTYHITFRTAQGTLSDQERHLVLDAIFHFHERRLRVHIATVMPDHVHAIITPLRKDDAGFWPLQELLHSIKSFTAHSINKSRDTTGTLWQDEYYDRLIRDSEEYEETHRYIQKNPVEGRLAANPGEYAFTRAGQTSEAIEDHGRDARATSEKRDPQTLTFHPPRYARTYETWHDNLRDWCISRQLWWGHQIPVWSEIIERSSEPDAAVEDAIANAVIDDIAHIEVQEIDAQGTQRRSVCLRRDDAALIEKLEAAGFTRDPDVLDTWFSSALWPLSTLGWPADDLPIVTPQQIDPNAHPNIRSVWVKRVGSFRDFIGTEGEHSGDLIDKLLHLRDTASTASGTQPLAYQLFSERDLRELGANAKPLAETGAIADATDMICAVGIKAEAPLESTKFGQLDIKTLLLAHGFQNTAGLLEAFNPTSVLTTAREIITLWVSRMVMFNRYFRSSPVTNGGGAREAGGGGVGAADGAGTPGPVPFRDVFIHAMIQDGEGRKMSKSLGNGVDPLDIISSHGADAMRFTLVEMTTQTQDVRMPVEFDEKTGKNTSPKFDLGRNFCNKLWNAARFALAKIPASNEPEAQARDASRSSPIPNGGGAREPGGGGAFTVSPASLSLPDRWMLTRLRTAIAEIDHALVTYQFAAYAKALYDIVRRDFCDWYLEAIKPTVATDPSQQAVLRCTLDALLRLLHPVTPFITEAMHEQLATRPAPSIPGLNLGDPADTLCTARWPAVDESLADPAAAQEFERLRSAIEALRAVRAMHKVDPKRKVTLHAAPGLAAFLLKHKTLATSLAALDAITADAPTATAPTASFTYEGAEHALSNLADAVDAGTEKDRLTKDLADLHRAIKQLEGRLSNPGYVDKAPAHLVDQTRDQLNKAKADRDTLAAALERLK